MHSGNVVLGRWIEIWYDIPMGKKGLFFKLGKKLKNLLSNHIERKLQVHDLYLKSSEYFCHQNFFHVLKMKDMQILYVFNTFSRTYGMTPLSNNISVMKHMSTHTT